MAFDLYETKEGKDKRLGLFGPVGVVKQMGIFVQYQPQLKALNSFFKSGESKSPKKVIKDLDALNSTAKIPVSLSLSFSNLYALMKRATAPVKIVQ